MRRILIVSGLSLCLGGLLVLGGCQALTEATAAANASNAAVETANATTQAAVQTAQSAVSTAQSVEQAAVSSVQTMINVALNPTVLVPSLPQQQTARLIVDTPTCTIIKQNGNTVIVMKPQVHN